MSLRTRLSLSIAALVLVAVAALGIAVYNLVGSRLDDRADSDLAVQADGLARAIAAAPPGSEAEAARSYIAGQALAGSRLLIAQVPGAPGPISNQSTLLLDRSGEDGHEGAEEHEEEEEHAQLRDLLEADPGYTTIELAETGDLRLLTREIDTPAGAATLQAGEPAAATEEAQHQVAKTFLLIGSLTVLAAAGLGLLIATRTARPLERMAGRAAAVDAGRLDQRMNEHSSVTEIAALAESFDRMLDRLEAAFRSQRAFVADASHELRTPLTAILGQAQVLAADPSPDPAEVARVTGLIEREAERMGALIDGLLQLERLEAEGAAEPVAPFDLAAVAAEVVAALPEEQAARVELDAGDAVSVTGRREDTVRIARNLLANALAYGERRVAISVAEAGGEGRLAVDDDGPGIPAGDRGRVFERFARLEASRSRQYGGSGLGLAISRELATAQSARIEVGDSPLGGARLTLCMPSARAGQ